MGNLGSKPVLKIWRFVDGKPGHERQTEGLIGALSTFCALETDTIPVANGRLSALQEVLLRHRQCRGEGPDLLMGAGHRTHLPLVWARWLTRARSVVLMRPSFPSWWFDYRIVPEHDKPETSENDLVVQGVLNTVSRGEQHVRGKGVILIGGPCRHVEWADAPVIDQVDRIVQSRPEVEWELTTSRRTPAALCEAFRKMSLGNFRYVSHLETGPTWVADHLQACRETWVTPDSVSMVFEAVTSGTHVGVFDLEWKNGTKLKTSIDRLVSDQMVTPFSAFDLKRELRAPSSTLNEAQRSARWLLERLRDKGPVLRGS